MGQLVLTEDQKTVLGMIGREQHLAGFYLSGGTALAAYYFEHRFSDDLDFFTEDEIDAGFLMGFAEKIKSEIKARDFYYEKLYDRNQFFFKTAYGEFKIEFTKYPFNQFMTPKVAGGVKIDSLRDISANKLMAMLDRFDPKDFVDLYFILQKTDIHKLKSDSEKKFGAKIDPLFLGGELAKARRISALPRMIKDLDLDNLKSFFEKLSKTLKPNIF